jgi:hypothetical protein
MMQKSKGQCANMRENKMSAQLGRPSILFIQGIAQLRNPYFPTLGLHGFGLFQQILMNCWNKKSMTN